MFEWLRALLQRRAPAVPWQVRWNAEGISLLPQSGTSKAIQHLSWRDVTLVVAYKKDCYAFDQVCLQIFARQTQGLLLTEGDEGFSDLINDLSKYLPEVPSDWYLALISTPAFDETKRILLKR